MLAAAESNPWLSGLAWVGTPEGTRTALATIFALLPMGLGILGVVLAAGSLNLDTIMRAQATDGWYFDPAKGLLWARFAAGDGETVLAYRTGP